VPTIIPTAAATDRQTYPAIAMRIVSIALAKLSDDHRRDDDDDRPATTALWPSCPVTATIQGSIAPSLSTISTTVRAAMEVMPVDPDGTTDDRRIVMADHPNADAAIEGAACNISSVV
jgi:hypothetical protein